MKHYSPRCIYNIINRLIDLQYFAVTSLEPKRYKSININEHYLNISYYAGKVNLSNGKDIDCDYSQVSLTYNNSNTHQYVYSAQVYSGEVFFLLFTPGYWCEYIEQLVVEMEKTKYCYPSNPLDVFDREQFSELLNTLIEEKKQMDLAKQKTELGYWLNSDELI